MTTVEQLQEWFDRGKAEKATHLVVVCDTFSHDDYPVYVKKGEDARLIVKKYDGQNMQKVMEVYNLKKSKKSQFEVGTRVFNY